MPYKEGELLVKQNDKYGVLNIKGNKLVKIEYDQILGKVLKKSTLLSLLSHVVNNAYGFYFIIFVPFAILLFFEINDIMKEKKLIKEAKEKKEDTKEKKILCDDEPIPKKK